MNIEKCTIDDMPRDRRGRPANPDGLSQQILALGVNDGFWVSSKGAEKIEKYRSLVSATARRVVSSGGGAREFTTRVSEDGARVGIWRLK